MSSTLTLTVKEARTPEPIPVGVYPARLAAVEEGQNGYGSFLKLTFAITAGEYRDVERSTIAKVNLIRGTKNSKLYNIIAALLGREPPVDQNIHLNDLVGAACQILIKNKPGSAEGWQIIAEVMPAAT
jgi:hypothetical protein